MTTGTVSTQAYANTVNELASTQSLQQKVLRNISASSFSQNLTASSGSNLSSFLDNFTASTASASETLMSTESTSNRSSQEQSDSSAQHHAAAGVSSLFDGLAAQIDRLIAAQGFMPTTPATSAGTTSASPDKVAANTSINLYA